MYENPTQLETGGTLQTFYLHTTRHARCKNLLVLSRLEHYVLYLRKPSYSKLP